ENLAENIVGVEAAEAGRLAAAGAAGRPAEAGRARPGLGAGAGAETLETLEARLAVGADQPPVEIGASLLVAENFVGGVDLGKVLLCPGFPALVGMMLLREASERLLDVGGRRTPRDAQHFVRITHACTLKRLPCKGKAGAAFQYGAKGAEFQ